MIKIHLLLLLLLVLHDSGCWPLNAPLNARLDPSKVAIVTVVDPSNEEVLRDVLTLIRSLRLYVGLLNDATFIACITVDVIPLPDERTVAWSSYFSQLVYVGAEISFIQQASNHLPKTLNKLDALSLALLDPFRFDYILWLDADIVVFGDPIVRGELRKHMYPGQIDCVPDFYSYLRRFPHVNSTNLVWNPALPTWFLLGDGEIAPHGTCNTGVLFFDTMTLRTLLEAMPSAMEQINQLNPFKQDRFLDSLYFVSAVNRAGITANILSYDMNYMPFFEQEIREENVITNDIVFAHFLSNTSFHCTQRLDEECACYYFNDATVQVDNSPILRKVQSLLPFDVCQVMAGSVPPPLPSHKQVEIIASDEAMMVAKFISSNSPDIVDSDYKSNTMDEMSEHNKQQQQQQEQPAHTEIGKVVSNSDGGCDIRRRFVRAMLIWPPQWGSIVHVARTSDEILLVHRLKFHFDVVPQHLMQCDKSDATADDAAITMTAITEVSIIPAKEDKINTFSPNFATAPSLSVNESVIHRHRVSLSSLLTNCRGQTTVDGGGDEVIIEWTSSFRLPSDIRIDPSGKLQLFVQHMISEIDDEVDSVSQPSSNVSSSLWQGVTVTLIVDSLVSRGITVYAPNPLLGSKSLTLRSQIYLHHFLHAHNLAGTGAVLCCNTYRGLTVVENLIASWQGDFLFIAVAAVPVGLQQQHDDEQLRHLAARFREQCLYGNTKRAHDHQSLLRCVVITSPPVVVNNDDNSDITNREIQRQRSRSFGVLLGRAMRPQSVSFFYTDIYTDYTAYTTTLTAWYPAVMNTGLLIGSRFMERSPVVVHESSLKLIDSTLPFPLTNVFAAVEWFADSISQTYFATYDEYSIPLSTSFLNAGTEIVAETVAPAWYMFKNPVKHDR